MYLGIFLSTCIWSICRISYAYDDDVIIFTRTDLAETGVDTMSRNRSRCECCGFHRMLWISVVHAANGIISVLLLLFHCWNMCYSVLWTHLVFTFCCYTRTDTSGSKLILWPVLWTRNILRISVYSRDKEQERYIPGIEASRDNPAMTLE